ncbi:helix-turn-helix domain-containing protein, partial [Blautia obeum]|uniref:helix-turn-helix domain-containing protein n=1 Tax=Blautia obeum TaxID=40520 RepID=UPI001D085DB0
MQKGIKFRIYPNRKQKNLIHRTLGCCRLIYNRGFVNFFQKRASHPIFKSKHNRFQSYRTINQKDNIRIVGRYIKLPKLGFVKVRQSMEIGKI